MVTALQGVEVVEEFGVRQLEYSEQVGFLEDGISYLQHTLPYRDCWKLLKTNPCQDSSPMLVGEPEDRKTPLGDLFQCGITLDF